MAKKKSFVEAVQDAFVGEPEVSADEVKEEAPVVPAKSSKEKARDKQLSQVPPKFHKFL